MVDDKFRYHLQSTLMCLLKKLLELCYSTIGWIDAVIVCYIVPIITQGRWVKGKHPYCGHSQFLQVVQLSHQSAEVTNAVSCAVAESLYMQLINNSVFIPV